MDSAKKGNGAPGEEDDVSPTADDVSVTAEEIVDDDFPPLPPRAIINLEFSLQRSTIISSLFLSFTIVPFGTLIIRSAPFFPSLSALDPFLPFSAIYFFLYLKSSKV